jgi:hypothetical protein
MGLTCFKLILCSLLVTRSGAVLHSKRMLFYSQCDLTTPKKVNMAIWARFMLLSHVLASLYLYISSKAMYSYITNPCGTLSVSFASFFQVESPLGDFISKWLISTWCQQGRKEHLPKVSNDQKITSRIVRNQMHVAKEGEGAN